MSSLSPRKKSGGLFVVGTGINSLYHLTPEARARIKHADTVLHAVPDAVTEGVIHKINPHNESLRGFYGEGKCRIQTYREMTEYTLTAVRSGRVVCMVFYGHPAVFVMSSHEAVMRARAEGYPAYIIPAVSAADCLFADLGIDPGEVGCQTFEATDFLLFNRRHDTRSYLLLFQVGGIGDLAYSSKGYRQDCLHILVESLLREYSPRHEVIIYEAGTHPFSRPRIGRVELVALNACDLSPTSTLCVPPQGKATVNRQMAMRLGLAPLLADDYVW